MVTEEMTQAEEERFNILYASSFILQTALDYAILLSVQFDHDGDKYGRNKAKDVEYTCSKLITCVQRQLTYGMTQEHQDILNNATDTHKQLIYDIFSFDAPEQARIRNLIAKIKRDKNK